MEMKTIFRITALIQAILLSSVSGQPDWVTYLETQAKPWPKIALEGDWFENLAQHRFVLLGESTHGTSEFYETRAVLTRKLLEKSHHRFVVVEGDWEGLKKANNYVQGESPFESAQEVLENLDRWPRWMWANREFAALLEWMREANRSRSEEQTMAIYGMDIYSWPASFDVLRQWLQENDSAYLTTFDRQMNPLVRYREEWPQYSAATWALATRGPETVPSALNGLMERIQASGLSDREKTYLLIRTKSVAAAEKHLREARLNSAESWNARARQMKRTLEHLSGLLPEDVGIVVWAHNTHIGDSRGTPMAAHGMVNIGYLLKEKKGAENVFLLGQTTGTGTFLGARSWEGNREIFAHEIPLQNSLEGLLKAQFDQPVLIPFAPAKQLEIGLPAIGHRAIGVVYQTDAPNQHYVPSQFPQRYDALLFIPETNALNPLHETE